MTHKIHEFAKEYSYIGDTIIMR